MINHSALNIKDGNDGVIIGVSGLSQLDENLNDCQKGPLPEEVLQALDKAWKVSQPDTPNYCKSYFAQKLLHLCRDTYPKRPKSPQVQLEHD